MIVSHTATHFYLMQIAAIMDETTAAESDGKLFTEAEGLALAAMDPEERKSRVGELRKMRALESFYASKCRRIRKIKSKKFHKVRHGGHTHTHVTRVAVPRMHVFKPVCCCFIFIRRTWRHTRSLTTDACI